MAYPAPFLEPAAERISDLIQSELRQPVDIASITPQVAASSPLVQAAQQRTATAAGLGALQFDPTTGALTGAGTGTGVASFEPFIQQAQTALGQAQTDIAAARGQIDPSAYQAYMSPYQQEVIDATQRQLDEQRAAGRAQLAASAISQGAFGQGRGQVAQAEYERQRDITDVGILSQLRQAGFEQAQQAARQAGLDLSSLGTQQMNLGQRQAGLGTTQQTLESGITAQLGRTGTGAQQFAQSLLEAQRQQNVLGLEYPLSRLGTAVNVLSPLISGAAAYQQPSAPLLTNPAIAGIQGLAGTYGLLQGPTQQAGRTGIGSLFGL